MADQESQSKPQMTEQQLADWEKAVAGQSKVSEHPNNIAKRAQEAYGQSILPLRRIPSQRNRY